jgi:LuxR family maltose regulon positive regulatory protein
VTSTANSPLLTAKSRIPPARSTSVARQRLVTESLPLHERAVRLSSTWGSPTYVVMALVGLGEASLARRDRDDARSAAAQAREAADADRIAEYAVRELEAFETRLGRGAARTARRSGLLYEELTDRELSILRLLPGTATQREIGASLYLSINTVKGSTKSLYRKLGVVTGHDAVEQGRSLGLV